LLLLKSYARLANILVLATLYVEQIKAVTWNKEAFDHLVLSTKTKDLVKALVMVRTSGKATTQALSAVGKRDDMIAGKGNALIMLLHGGPGTGKTLTAGKSHIESHKEAVLTKK